ncbi:putative anti-sigma regulatory factor, serine/threonine protein kinase [Catenulispora acidiphila DSM 44928]|uniref:Putative anti-sigma regulatory factor, serine/threonine protein kinase n=1 Tax=Catenulispora acidiphila (strain DSM 44928 / JCM 14897 / NBRC 102108 / NRRL B-24433 / ID139908) TaxID=479433 RepID=C7Q6Z5_CATAD|nr:ATP-binding protein [Catenulispora acidiphila]ACU76008.1 putative anti-sigma regulatory factor, serine/threonine protein kinase [Catenulispora acidiphila DSM 44928]
MQQSRGTEPFDTGRTVRRKHGARPERAQPDRSRVNSLSWSFPGTPADVSCSRHWLAIAATEAWGECEDTDRLVLAYSEIATNAVVHGAGPVTVAAQICATSARCEIADRSTRLPKVRHATAGDLGGRGLEMVELTVDRLRVAADEVGKTVSFEVGRRDERDESGSPAEDDTEG